MSGDAVGDAISSMIDMSIAARGHKTCMFPGTPPFQADLPTPVPKTHEVDGVKYVLDYDGTFFAGYRRAK